MCKNITGQVVDGQNNIAVFKNYIYCQLWLENGFISGHYAHLSWLVCMSVNMHMSTTKSLTGKHLILHKDPATVKCGNMIYR